MKLMFKFYVPPTATFDEIYDFVVANYKSTALTREFWFDVLSQYLERKPTRFRPILLNNNYNVDPKIWLWNYESEIATYVDETDLIRGFIKSFQCGTVGTVTEFIALARPKFEGITEQRTFEPKLFKALMCDNLNITPTAFELIRFTITNLKLELTENNYKTLCTFARDASRLGMDDDS